MPIYIARFSYGKDSFKMLEVIKSRGLPLDRITTSDVWATETISANLPPVEEFKAKADEFILKEYGIEVEHLCARNKDGTKKTYESEFYRIPKRSEKKADLSELIRSKDLQHSVVRGVRILNGIPMPQIQGTIKGFPGTTAVPWCKKLKTRMLAGDFCLSP